MERGDGIADASRVVSQHGGDRFLSPTDRRAALLALRRACVEWPPHVVADVMSQVLLEGQEPDATLARTIHQGIARLINHYYRTAVPVPDAPPEWLTPLVIERVSRRLRDRVE